MSHRGKLTALAPLVVAIAVMLTSRHPTSAAAQDQRPTGGRGAGRGAAAGAPPSRGRGDNGGAPPATNGVPGTPIRQNPDINRPLQNEPIQSAAFVGLRALMGSYGNIGMGNDLPNPDKRIEPWGELPASYEGHWAAPTGAGGGPDGLLYVLERCRNNSCKGQPQDPILVIDPKTGKLIRSFGATLYDGPHGLHVDGDNNIWTADQANMLVRKWSKDGKLLMTIGKENDSTPAPGTLFEPTDVVTSATGDIFITEGHAKLGPNSRVSKYSKDGKFIKYLGPATGSKAGNGPLQVSAPHAIAIDARGRLFIADRDNNRILIWDQDGKYIAEWRQFSRPSGLYITKDDRIYVADSESWGPDNPGWKKGVRVGSALTGVVENYLQDIESMDFVHSGPEFVGVDAMGNIYACVVRRQQLERHEPPAPIPTRAATWPN
jgi:sugar lactone lactonase YvrE